MADLPLCTRGADILDGAGDLKIVAGLAHAFDGAIDCLPCVWQREQIVAVAGVAEPGQLSSEKRSILLVLL